MTDRPDFLPSSTVSVGMHLYETTTFATHLYPDDDRVTVDAAGSGGTVTLFLDRPEITRLRGVLEQAEQDLTEQQQKIGVRAISGPAA
ncbi:MULTISPECIES: hypothetical protein [Pseudonocardia]|uniref:Uncharacterized protein n=2 Tax=Pseudonocardia TaxID=1847 RepID=A0A1Y2MJR8_PSEAH|nr:MULTISPECIES: hypothetical protein [Pseudonocardia]OSY34688.1 hypothetical protein BG845_06621 [Pseudonocardia autotrophica]TDN73235.1 hypothetical protein C8E95_2323 [Pseudonocardia autotrophica]BBG03967.1 hypothetical protein Pdca_51760 [Pseudonocardia autotrophica]GEC29247.1 hypothetical protein PSA01_62760 [Pseudonocardia saturnea]